MIDSIMPILTKVDPNDENIDIDIIRHVFGQQLSEEVRAQKAEKGLLQDQVLEPDEEDGEEKDADSQRKKEKIVQLEEFYKQFAHKLVIYDPLERRIPAEGSDDDGSDDGEKDDDDDDEENENQAISREELLKQIEEMPSMKGDLNAPMTNKMHSDLESLLESEDIKCKDLAEAYFLRAKTEDMSKSINFADELVVVNFRETLQFFKKYELFEGAAK